MTPRRAGALAAAAAFVLAGCIQQPGGDPALADGPIVIEARAAPFHSANPDTGRAGRLVFRGALALRSDDPRFGGLSALHVSADGARLTAIGDKGHRVSARLRYDSAGRLAGIDDGSIAALRDPAGRSVVATRMHDAESLAATADGFAVGFEGEHRIWLYPGNPPFAAPPVAVTPPPGLEKAPINEGVEALAALADGRLVAITQGLGLGKNRVRGWIGARRSPTGIAWQPFAWARDGRFEPADAVGLENGDLLVLERRFTWAGGFALRLALAPAAALRANATVAGDEIGRIEPPFLSDNFEGLAARRGARGETLLYLISDDNFHPLQRTLLVMLELAD